MKKLFLVLSFFVVLLSFSCNQIRDNNSIKDVGEGMAVLEFGDSIVVMEMSDDEKFLKSGDTVKEGTPVMIALKERI